MCYNPPKDSCDNHRALQCHLSLTTGVAPMVPFLFRQWISKLKVSTGGNSSSYRPGRKSVATHRLISAAPSFRPARLYLEPLEDRTVPNAALLDPNPQETDFLIPSSSTPIADPLATPPTPPPPYHPQKPQLEILISQASLTTTSIPTTSTYSVSITMMTMILSPSPIAFPGYQTGGST